MHTVVPDAATLASLQRLHVTASGSGLQTLLPDMSALSASRNGLLSAAFIQACSPASSSTWQVDWSDAYADDSEIPAVLSAHSTKRRFAIYGTYPICTRSVAT